MSTTEQPTVYRPWQPDDQAEPKAPVVLPSDIVPVVPAHNLPRALAWTVARTLRLNPECGMFPIEGCAAPTADGTNTPPEAAVFDLTAVTLETASGTRPLDINRKSQDTPDPWQYPPVPVPDLAGLNTPEIIRAQAIILSVSIRHPNGAVVEDDIGTDLVISGRAGDDTALAAFAAGSWLNHDAPDLADLICEALWDWTVIGASDDDFERFCSSVRSETGLLLEHAGANDTEQEKIPEVYQTFTANPEMAMAAARQLSVLEGAS